MPAEPDSFATIARIRRPWGRRGEVIADLFTDFPQRFAQLEWVWLERSGAERWQARLEHWRLHQDAVLLKFAGVDDIGAAQGLAGCEVRIAAAERLALSGPAVYWSDLAGCRVVERGTELGVVRHLDPTVGTPVLVVDTPQGELQIPFAAEICRRVDTAARLIEVELPEGLRELNR